MVKRYGFGRSVAFVVLILGIGGCLAIAFQNTATSQHPPTPITDEASNVLHGYQGNIMAEDIIAATISGGGRLGFPNTVTADMGSIGGGAGNEAGNMATVGGGLENIASGLRATIGGGARNSVSRENATVGGGFGNSASGNQATIAGGNVNEATEINATVGGGSGNIASERHATVAGGTVNRAAGFGATTGGGIYNTARTTYATVSGGIANTSSGIESTVGGGAGNSAEGEASAIAGGMGNRATDNYSAISGGRANIAGDSNTNPTDAAYATVGGGEENVASGAFSVIPGGRSNRAAGRYSFAVGHRAKVKETHHGSFLFSDDHDYDFPSISANEFAVRATGGIRFATAIDGVGNPVAGIRLISGSGSWETLSDRHVKTSFAPVDGRTILERLMKLPLATWSYKTQDPSVRHIGPTAQDFYKIFQIGADSRHISTVDADGVALGAIQGLYQLVQEKGSEIRAQQQQIKALAAMIGVQRDQIAALEAQVAEIEEALAKNGPISPR